MPPTTRGGAKSGKTSAPAPPKSTRGDSANQASKGGGPDKSSASLPLSILISEPPANLWPPAWSPLSESTRDAQQCPLNKARNKCRITVKFCETLKIFQKHAESEVVRQLIVLTGKQVSRQLLLSENNDSDNGDEAGEAGGEDDSYDNIVAYTVAVTFLKHIIINTAKFDAATNSIHNRDEEPDFNNILGSLYKALQGTVKGPKSCTLPGTILIQASKRPLLVRVLKGLTIQDDQQDDISIIAVHPRVVTWIIFRLVKKWYNIKDPASDETGLEEQVDRLAILPATLAPTVSLTLLIIFSRNMSLSTMKTIRIRPPFTFNDFMTQVKSTWPSEFKQLGSEQGCTFLELQWCTHKGKFDPEFDPDFKLPKPNLRLHSNVFFQVQNEDDWAYLLEEADQFK